MMRKYKLNDKLEDILRLSSKQKDALKKYNLETVKDLLYYFPFRYEDYTSAKYISELQDKEQASIYASIIKFEKKLSWKQKKYYMEAFAQDRSGIIKLIWFNQIYIEKILKEGKSFKITGKVYRKNNTLYMSNPNLEEIPSIPEFLDSSNELLAVYHERTPFSSRWFSVKIDKILKNLDENSAKKEILPEHILKKYKLPHFKKAVFWIHNPKTQNQAKVAEKRFAFEEVFVLQSAKELEKEERKKEKSVQITINNETLKQLDRFLSQLPFKLTGAQQRVIKEISEDLKKTYPSARLLQGDVGSGKTVVAAAAAFLTINSKSKDNKYKSLQVAYMAPTEILAKQIFEEFVKLFKNKNVKIGFASSSHCAIFPSKTNGDITRISCAQLGKWVKEGVIPIVIGTHSLIFDKFQFENLALAIVDEQHRFGTKQRAKLSRKDGARAHLLSMSATPIPRTLALSIYGDLELSVLDELPPGRKEVKTKIIKKSELEESYEFIRKKLKEGRQAYVICPRVEEPDPEKANALRVKSVEEELKKLREGPFSEFTLAPMHGKMNPKNKDKIMKKFANKEIDILVATSVVEVGVNVPNATIIMIEGAERFGLAQLHQLRGRVRRSSFDAYCFLVPENMSKKSYNRLKALEETQDGFHLAEIDLQMRGPGELLGSKQWGISDNAMKALKNIKMISFAKQEAEAIIKQGIDKYPYLKQAVKNMQNKAHLE